MLTAVLENAKLPILEGLEIQIFFSPPHNHKENFLEYYMNHWILRQSIQEWTK